MIKPEEILRFAEEEVELKKEKAYKNLLIELLTDINYHKRDLEIARARLKRCIEFMDKGYDADHIEENLKFGYEGKIRKPIF